MSSNRDTKSKRRVWLRKSGACGKQVHWLCIDSVRCACSCHTAELSELLDKLADECERRAMRLE